MTGARGDGVVGRRPGGAVRDGVGESVLECEVERDGGGVAGGGKHAGRAGILAVAQHRPEGERDAPGESRDRHGRAEGAVADLARGGDALRTRRGDHDRHLERPRGAVPVRLQHLHHGALPLHLLPAEQRTQDTHVLDHTRPLERPLSEHQTAGESGAHRDRDAIGTGDRRQGGDRRRVHHGMPQAGHEHAGPESDAGRPLGRAAERHPHVRQERRRVVEPGARVAELLGDARVLVALVGGAEGAGQRQGRGHGARRTARPARPPAPREAPAAGSSEADRATDGLQATPTWACLVPSPPTR